MIRNPFFWLVLMAASFVLGSGYDGFNYTPLIAAERMSK